MLTQEGLKILSAISAGETFPPPQRSYGQSRIHPRARHQSQSRSTYLSPTRRTERFRRNTTGVPTAFAKWRGAESCARTTAHRERKDAKCFSGRAPAMTSQRVVARLARIRASGPSAGPSTENYPGPYRDGCLLGGGEHFGRAGHAPTGRRVAGTTGEDGRTIEL